MMTMTLMMTGIIGDLGSATNMVAALAPADDKDRNGVISTGKVKLGLLFHIDTPTHTYPYFELQGLL